MTLAELSRRCRRAARAGLLGVATWLAATTGAAAQSGDLGAILDRINLLEQTLADVQRQLYRGGVPRAPADTLAPPAAGEAAAADTPAAARLSVRLGELEEQMRLLTGRIEEVDFLARQVEDRTDKLVADVDFRLTAIERNLAAAAPGSEAVSATGPTAPRAAPIEGQVAVATPPGGGARTLGTISESDLANVRAGAAPGETAETAKPGAETAKPATETPVRALANEQQPARVLPEGPPREQYRFAMSELRRGDFDAAEQAFSAFLASHPKDELAGNAQYWLGETYYVRRDYERAAAAFLAGYQRYGDSVKAPDNLLKLGITLNLLGQKEDACGVFEELTQRFPDASTPILQRLDRERDKTGCS